VRARIYLVLFLLLVVVAGSAYACGEAMRVREVVVLGCEVKDPAQVADLASIANEESIFKIKFKEVRQKIDADPYFEVQSIRYVFPDKLRISVSERKAGAVINHLGSIIVVDETGYILEVLGSLGDLSLPVVSGLRITEGYKVGETVASSQENQLDALHAILTQLHEQNATQLISEINLDAISDLWMTTVSGYEVRLGNFEDMESKIRWLRAVEPILVSEGYKGGVITVSTGKNASYLPVEGDGRPIDPIDPDGGTAPEPGGQEPQASPGGQDTPEPSATPGPDGTPEPTPSPTDEPEA
jgi:cell division protein FtsQ